MPPTQPRRWTIFSTTWWLIKLVLAVGIFGGLFAVIYMFQFKVLPAMIREGIANAPPQVETISAEAAKLQDWVPVVRAIGTVSAVNGIDVSPQIGGIVQEFFFDSGQEVPAGAKLVKLDTDVLDAELRSLKANLEFIQQQLDRASKLVKQGYATRAENDNLISQRNSTQANIERAEAMIAQKTIYAPFAGRLGMRRVDVGSYVSAGTPLVWVQTVDPVYVDFPVPEREFAFVHVSQPFTAVFDAWPDRKFKGEIESIDARVNETSRTVTVRGRLPNPTHEVVPGMFANVTVVTGAAAQVLTVPQTAITYSLYGDSVFVVSPAKNVKADPDAKDPALAVEPRFVKVGEVRDGRVAVAQGLKAGEQVVTVGQLKLRAGSRVRINNDVALNAPAVRKTE